MPLTVVLELILVYVILCSVAGFLGRKRRIGFWGFFFLSLLVTPLLSAMFIYVAAPVRRPRVAPKRT